MSAMSAAAITVDMLEKSIKEAAALRAENERLQTALGAANQRAADLERDLSIEVAAGYDVSERAEAAERERDELRAKWSPLVTWAAAKEKAGKGESMSSDIVERLRFAANDPAGTDTHVAIYRDLCDEVATEVERLRGIERILRDELDKDHSEIERLRAALRQARADIAAISKIDAALSGQPDAKGGQDRTQQPKERQQGEDQPDDLDDLGRKGEAGDRA